MWAVTLFDRVAPAYDLLAPAVDPAPLVAGLALAERPVERVLDLGGGSGRAVRALDGVDGVVVDAAPGMARAARRQGPSAAVGDGARLPVCDATFDATLVVDALHHLPKPGDALAEVARVLRPGGVVVVREFDPTMLRGGALALAERAVGFDSTFFPPTALADALTAAGLRATLPDRGVGYTAVGVAPPDDAEPGEP